MPAANCFLGISQCLWGRRQHAGPRASGQGGASPGEGVGGCGPAPHPQSEAGPAHSRQQPQRREQACWNHISPPRTALTTGPKPQGHCFRWAQRQSLSQAQGKRPLSGAPHRGSPCGASAEVPATPSSSRGLWTQMAGVKLQRTTYCSRDPGHTASAPYIMFPSAKRGNDRSFLPHVSVK